MVSLKDFMACLGGGVEGGSGIPFLTEVKGEFSGDVFFTRGTLGIS